MKYAFAFMLFSNIALATNNCLVPESSIEPEIEVEISKEGDVFTYNYILKNPSHNKLPIPLINIETGIEPIEVISPEGWKEMKSPRPQSSFIVRWADLSGKKLSPGSVQKGFIIKSKNHPGIIQVKIKGKNLKPYATNEIVKKDNKTICPGIWLAGSTAEKDNYVSTIAEGPVPDNTITVPLKIKFSGDKVWKGGLLESADKILISSNEKKSVELMIESNQNFDVDSLELNSLKIGRAQIRPNSVKVISDFGDQVHDIKSTKTYVKNILLTFNSEDANILCDVDQSLAVIGITKEGTNFFAVTRISRTPCTLENWTKEAAKIKAFRPEFYK